MSYAPLTLLTRDTAQSSSHPHVSKHTTESSGFLLADDKYHMAEMQKMVFQHKYTFHCYFRFISESESSAIHLSKF